MTKLLIFVLSVSDCSGSPLGEFSSNRRLRRMKRAAEPRKARPAFRQGTAKKGKLYQYGQRTRIDYGNGTFTEYNYDTARRWLDTIKTQNKWGKVTRTYHIVLMRSAMF